MRWLSVLAGLGLLACSAPVHASFPRDASTDYQDAYRENRICYVELNGNGPTIPVIDTWVPTSLIKIPDGWALPPGAGSLSMSYAPCQPTACPEGTFLVSATCMSDDPFEFVPVEFDSPEQQETSTVGENRVDSIDGPARVTFGSIRVGPLIEPPIVG